MGKLFEKDILKIVQRHIEVSLLNACQFGLRVRHSTTLQRLKFTDHMIPNFNNNISTAAVFLDIEKAFDTTWHTGLLYELSQLHFSSSLIKLISSFLYNRKFRVTIEGELPVPRDIEAGILQVSVLFRTLYSLYINDTPQTPEVYVALFADDTCIYTTDRKEGYVLRQLQRGLTSVESCCERWNIKINEDKTQAIYVSHRLRPFEAFLTLKGRQIPFVNNVNYLGLIFHIAAKAFRIFYMGTCGGELPFEIAASAKQSSPHQC
jgi:hypothetical protein